jgi:hypothetical protein
MGVTRYGVQPLGVRRHMQLPKLHFPHRTFDYPLDKLTVRTHNGFIHMGLCSHTTEVQSEDDADVDHYADNSCDDLQREYG